MLLDFVTQAEELYLLHSQQKHCSMSLYTIHHGYREKVNKCLNLSVSFFKRE